ncbi:SOS response-associated peptidase [Zavarzinella formosa]|uniref:SOS response-associated peptidase n=1 Tax=Zavarzinella formosa TaxID=360055 RepID=UPI000308121E|nr:SOS response-associated peptidase [Zavarzinella formosa]
MCARFALYASLKMMMEKYHFADTSEITPRFNIAPSQPILALGMKADRRTLGATQFHWGLVPYWAAEANGPRPVNAKAESLTNKPMFRDSFRKRRCIIPASGYYEWLTKGRQKIPMFIRHKNLELMSFAGIWDCWKRGTEKLFTCAIVTTEANELTRSLHDRMPVILSPEDHANWLDPNTTDQATLLKILKPYSESVLEIILANPVVNSSKHEGPDCLIVPSATAWLPVADDGNLPIR